ncbi:hypothetical protein F4781DRAFT_403414 [Annulohypoxylon bovei var. microspora]|nr:hypothetical protein F4781DRAFT_403414 [Annulohypoxylon bovei var. microspora]
MCLGHKDITDDPAPKPAQVQPPSSIRNPKASMPQDYAPPPGPPPSHGQGHSYHSQNQSQSQSQYQSTNYAPPPGPPPSHQNNYRSPAGPHSSDTKNNPFFTPDPNSSSGPQDTEYAPPPGPPPSYEKPQHDWQTAVPDTALLPPPPDFFSGYDRSPTNNASGQECEAGEQWCREHPLYNPMPLSPSTSATVAAAQTGNVTVYAPPFFTAGGRGSLTQTGTGAWNVRSSRGAPDTCLATWPPLYQASAHSPLVTGRKRTAYYEVRILEDGSRGDEVGLAVGFSAPPYPAFRLPGWHRGSVGVHGDDGHKYINDRWGGKAFATPFRRGETVGVGVQFDARQETGGIGVRIFLTRNGAEEGRWDLHEETDREQDLPVTGLEGYHDLCASVGFFEKVAFEFVFVPALWKWRGYEG